MSSEKSTIQEIASRLRTGSLSAFQLAQDALARARQTADLNAFAFLDEDGALSAAEERDREARSGRIAGPLHGIPVSIKDLFNVRGMPTLAGTRAPLPVLGPEEAPAVARLRAAGAIILGKTNMHEVALGVTGENRWTADVRNPLDPTRQAGGSSSGSAAAVAAGIGLASLGTDTGGSIRIPASNCGLVGFKGTHGLVPLSGALALSPTCDHAGPLANSVADARLLAEVLAAVNLVAPPLARRLRLGVPRRYLEGWLSQEMRAAFESLLKRLSNEHAVADIEPADLDQAVIAYTPLVRAEAAFVHRKALGDGGEGFSEPVRSALSAGKALTAGEYLEARRLRDLAMAGLDSALAGVDAMVLPVTPVPAPKIGTTEIELESGPAPHRAAYLHLTCPFSLAGLPTACLPFAEVDGLPVGLQVVGARGEDARVLAIAERLEAQFAAD